MTYRPRHPETPTILAALTQSIPPPYRATPKAQLSKFGLRPGDYLRDPTNTLYVVTAATSQGLSVVPPGAAPNNVVPTLIESKEALETWTKVTKRDAEKELEKPLDPSLD